MKFPGIGRIQKVAKKIRTRLSTGGIILMYHRVADVPTDPFRTAVSPKNFSEHLAVLKRHCRTVSLQQMMEMAQAGESLEGTVAITFDDGYSDNLYGAKPLLERYGVPATMFITTGNLHHNEEFWWDVLDRVLLQPGTLPQTLQLTIRRTIHTWDLGDSAYYSQADFERDRNWEFYAAKPFDPTPRQAIYRALSWLFFPLSVEERQALTMELLAWSQVSADQRRPTHRSLLPEEIRKLGSVDLIEIGAHTVSHPQLATLPLVVQEQEIFQSKTDLEQILGYSIDSFSYPYGNYDDRTLDLMKSAGFAYACSTDEGKVRAKSDALQLPRVEVKNWNGEEFSNWLLNWI